MLESIGTTLRQNWRGIEESYRPTCKKIISYAFNHDFFDEEELAKKLISKEEVDDVTKSVESFVKANILSDIGNSTYISKSVQLLVQANILSDIGNGTYTLHSKLEKEYLVTNMNKLL